MSRKVRIILISVVVCIVILILSNIPYNDKQVPPAPDYSDMNSWFMPDSMFVGKGVDVFYVTPTTTIDVINIIGDTYHNMDINDTNQRHSCDNSTILGRRVFADSCNFYSPYYRQISMESWMLGDDVINERFAIAYEDVERAFDYYIKNFNNGRPFVLAGHSQGAKCVIELLKNKINDTTAKLLVAAYPIGFPVKEADVKSSKYLKHATDSIDIGKFITFCSVANVDAISPALSGSGYCINPFTWQIDGCMDSKVVDMPFFDRHGNIINKQYHTLEVCVDTVENVLIVNGLDPEEYFLPDLKEMFLIGNYHIIEYNIYFNQLRKNVLDRIKAYYVKHGR